MLSPAGSRLAFHEAIGKPGGKIGGDLFFRQGEEFYRRHFCGDFGACAGDDGNAGGDAVGAAGEQAQHASGVLAVYRLTEDLIVERNRGVGAKNDQISLGA